MDPWVPLATGTPLGPWERRLVFVGWTGGPNPRNPGEAHWRDPAGLGPPCSAPPLRREVKLSTIRAMIRPSKTPCQGQLGAMRPSKTPFQSQLGAIRPSKAMFQRWILVRLCLQQQTRKKIWAFGPQNFSSQFCFLARPTLVRPLAKISAVGENLGCWQKPRPLAKI